MDVNTIMLNLISNIRTNRLQSKNDFGFKTDLKNISTDEMLPHRPSQNIIYSKNWLDLYR